MTALAFGGEATVESKKMRIRPVIRSFSADTMLSRWGFRVSGGTLKNPLQKSNGGNPSKSEEDAQIVDYVQRIEGFVLAKPVLKFRYIEGRVDLGKFDPRLPGESLEYALGRLGWKSCIGKPLPVVGAWMLAEFRDRLEGILREDPFVFYCEMSSEEDMPHITDEQKKQLVEWLAKERKRPIRHPWEVPLDLLVIE